MYVLLREPLPLAAALPCFFLNVFRSASERIAITASLNPKRIRLPCFLQRKKRSFTAPIL
ncbi:hypothetical protein D1872_184180 [compost metagenome]